MYFSRAYRIAWSYSDLHVRLSDDIDAVVFEVMDWRLRLCFCMYNAYQLVPSVI